MTQRDKLIQKLCNNPVSLKYAEIEKILIWFGCIKISAKGSHIKFKHPSARFDLIIPVHQNDCKDFYKRNALKYIKDNDLHLNYETND